MNNATCHFEHGEKSIHRTYYVLGVCIDLSFVEMTKRNNKLIC
jgi:hypothetical protein